MRHAKPPTPFRQVLWGVFQERLRALPRYGGKPDTRREAVKISVVGGVAVIVLVATAAVMIF